MYYIVQENIFSDINYNKIFTSLDRLELEYEIVSVNSENIFKFNTDRKDVFVFGGNKLARISKQYNWNPGSLLSEKYDYTNYQKFYKEHLLNFDNEIKLLKDNIILDPVKFIKPVKDSKSFTGQLFNQHKFDEFQNHILNNPTDLLNGDVEIIISTKKDIIKEARFWIVNKKIIVYSTYKVGDRILWSSDYVDATMFSFCRAMINIHNLDDCFTMDICELSNGDYKIVECNCINSAGFYDIDLTKLLINIEKFYGH